MVFYFGPGYGAPSDAESVGGATDEARDGRGSRQLEKKREKEMEKEREKERERKKD